MKLAAQMDPIESITIKGDTTFALMLESQKRGHAVYVFQPSDVYFENGAVSAHAMKIEVKDDPADHYKCLWKGALKLESLDILLIRQDPPFDMAYVANTFILELLTDKVVMFNSPRAIRNFSEKLRALPLHKFMPKTFIGSNPEDIERFSKKFKEVVLKPLFLGGGSSVVRTSARNKEFKKHMDRLLRESGKEPIIAQEFIPQVVRGDKRVFILDGEIAGTLRRTPASGDFRANIHAGGSPSLDSLTPEEEKICREVVRLLEKEGIIFAGIDLIHGRLNEVNVTSPTLIREYLGVSGIDLAPRIMERLEAKIGKT